MALLQMEGIEVIAIVWLCHKSMSFQGQGGQGDNQRLLGKVKIQSCQRYFAKIWRRKKTPTIVPSLCETCLLVLSYLVHHSKPTSKHSEFTWNRDACLQSSSLIGGDRIRIFAKQTTCQWFWQVCLFQVDSLCKMIVKTFPKFRLQLY